MIDEDKVYKILNSNNKFIYRIRVYFWHNIWIGWISIGLLLLFVSIVLFLCGIFLWKPLLFGTLLVVTFLTPITFSNLSPYYRMFKPKAGYILYYYKTDTVYCIISRQNGKLTYYNFKTKMIESCDENKFFDGRYIKQIGFDKELKNCVR